MSSIINGALGSMIALGLVVSTLKPAEAQTKEAPAAMSTDQQDAIRDALDLAPGTQVDIEFRSRDGGSLRTANEGRGVGAGATAIGDELSDQFTGSPPSVGLGADGSQTAQGGGADREASGSAVRIPPMPWQNPMFWIGLAGLAAAGGCMYFGLKRAAIISALGGVGLLTAAFFPAVLLFVAAGVVLVIAFPYIKAEFESRKLKIGLGEMTEYGRKQHEALRAVVAGVDGPGVDPSAKREVKRAIAHEATEEDRGTIKAVKLADEVGKYQE